MNLYKVEFASNEILSCNILNDGTTINSAYQYAHKKGELIYALIQADVETEARNIAKEIVVEITGKIIVNNVTT